MCNLLSRFISILATLYLVILSHQSRVDVVSPQNPSFVTLNSKGTMGDMSVVTYNNLNSSDRPVFANSHVVFIKYYSWTQCAL